jgi:riboflavin kinase/FMN adenylyltransferase
MADQRMRVVPGIDAIPAGSGPAFVVVGVFDGLHLGHLYLLEHLVRAAAERGAVATVVTFDHHPDEVLTGSAPPLLCDPDERLRLLAAAGIGMTVVQHFDLALRMTPFDAFVRRIAARTALAGFLMTPDSAFGHERGGTPATLAELGRTMGFEVAVVPALELDGRPVRSGEIRADIAAGDLAGAARLLGRPHAIVGRLRDDGRFEPPLPIALPPTGDHPVSIVAVDDGGCDRAATLRVGADGGLVVADADLGSARVRVTFAG